MLVLHDMYKISNQYYSLKTHSPVNLQVFEPYLKYKVSTLKQILMTHGKIHCGYSLNILVLEPMNICE